MAECIYRDAAIAACYDGFADCRDDCAANIRNLPAADVVERKTGQWIHDTFGKVNIPIVKCSKCGLKEVWHEEYGMGFALRGQKYANFCPNCGAQMIGGDEDV